MSRLITWYIRIAWTWKNCQCLTIWLVPVPNYTIRCATSAFVTFHSELPVETEWIRCVAGDPKGLSLKLECWVLSTERLSAWCNVSGSWGWSVLIEYWGQCLTTVGSLRFARRNHGRKKNVQIFDFMHMAVEWPSVMYWPMNFYNK